MMSSEAKRLEDQAETQRLALGAALEDLRSNLRPDNLAQEALSHVYGDGTAAVRAIGTATRQNPVPATLIGAGVAMLLGLGRQAARPASAGTTLPALLVAQGDGSLASRIRGRPLLFGALGVALGAAIGAVIS